MRRITCAIAGLAALLSLTAADPEDDLARLQGQWAMASLEIDGVPETKDQVASGKLVVEGNHYTPNFAGQAYPETFTLGPDRSPREIDFTYIDGPRKGEVVKGIYKLEGDRYVMCRALRDEDPRPTEFATRPDSGLALVVWKRAKSADGGKP